MWFNTNWSNGLWQLLMQLLSGAVRETMEQAFVWASALMLYSTLWLLFSDLVLSRGFLMETFNTLTILPYGWRLFATSSMLSILASTASKAKWCSTRMPSRYSSCMGTITAFGISIIPVSKGHQQVLGLSFLEVVRFLSGQFHHSCITGKWQQQYDDKLAHKNGHHKKDKMTALISITEGPFYMDMDFLFMLCSNVTRQQWPVGKKPLWV